MLNALMFSDTKKIFSALGEDNVRFVGGCVRDLLAGRKVKDIDFATTITPDNVLKLLEKANIRYFATGIEHGSIVAVINNKTYDITTLRRDVATDGRHAKIEYIDDWEQDAARRDFTFNAFYLNASGKLFDYFGGMDHLKGGKVVFIGDAEKRIREDYLRILRYYRFFGIFGKDIPESFIAKTFSSCASGIAKLSGERIQAEMKKVLELPNCVTLLTYMAQHGVLGHLMQGELHLGALQQLIDIEAEIKLVEPDYMRRLAIIEGFDLLKLCERWRLTGAQQKLVKLISTPQDFSDPKVALRRLGPERFVDCVLISAARNQLNYHPVEMIQFARTWQIPKFPVYGRDALKFGLTEGKLIGQVLMQIEHVWEQNSYALSRDELLAMLQAESAKYLPKPAEEPKTVPEKPFEPIAAPTQPKVVVGPKVRISGNIPKPDSGPVIFGKKKKDE